MMNVPPAPPPPDLPLVSLNSVKTRLCLCGEEIIGLTCLGGEKVSDHSRGQGCSEEGGEGGAGRSRS